jgi:hypothetical protein
MAKPTQITGIVDIVKKRQELEKQLDMLKQQEIDLARKQVGEIKREVQIAMEELAQKIEPLISQELWSWKSGEFDQALKIMGLSTNEPKEIVVKDELKNKIVECLKSGPLGVDDIATKLAVKVGSLRPKMPILVASGVLKTKPDPMNGRRNLYLVE